MPRKAATSAELVQDAPVNEEAVNVIQNLGAIAQGMDEERDLVNQLLGQAQMAETFGKFSQTVWASKLAFVKENKLYRAIKGKTAPNGLVFSGTWEEFCSLLGVSDEKANQDIANLRAFGEEALEAMTRMGIGYRDLRQWRRLPDDAKSALIEASKQGNLDAVQFLAEELIHTHTKEKDELQKKLTDTQADYDALGEVLSKKSAELDRTKQDLEKAKRRIETMSADDAAKELRQEVVGIAFEAEADISGKLRAAFESLEQHATETGSDHRGFQAQLIAHLQRLLGELKAEFQLPEVGEEEDFSWMHQEGVKPITDAEA
ncbi:hypothetical protein [Ectopseudomonas toyotomiensis]|uniref:Uncharacterized protein n=2 Tax=Ectopseudomonas toyotomiensis TaxID=554344 RepID=A0A1I5Z5F1_9GAMM|nr:hypothetical protein [Pseudomonas toyotomiensis]SFQ51692.1 hypothetical protein SAMN05216177_1273 [Pseudomonas toyotomiensis]